MSKATAFDVQPSSPSFEVQPLTTAFEVQPSTCPVEAIGAPTETFYLFDGFDENGLIKPLLDGAKALIDRP